MVLGHVARTHRKICFRERSCYKEYIYSFNNKVMTHNRSFKVCVLFVSSEFRVGAGHMDDSMKFQRVSADSR